MSDLKATEKDFELVDLYKETKNENLLIQFYEKFSKDICNIVFYRINSRFYSVPIEKDDLMHLIWKAVKVTFNECDSKDKNKIINYVIHKTYQATLREIRRFLTNGERVMNNVLSLEELFEQNRNFEHKSDNIVFIKKSYSDTYKEISDFIIKRISKLDKNDVKKVIYLKSLGYTDKDIMKKLNFSRNYVRKIVLTIKKIGEKY